MTAELPAPDRTPGRRVRRGPGRRRCCALLAHRNIASKADVIHRYDHEIGGGTVVRPLVGRHRDGPGDGVVLADPRDTHGLAIGIGVNPWYGLHDPEAMAHAVVDEAIRNVVAVGADPDRVALLDNFSWGDPRRPTTLGELVAAVQGCHDAALAHGAPFVSGKDSLNNEYTGADGRRHAVPPTLVITAVAHVPDVGRCVTAELIDDGNVVLLLGATRPEFAGSHLDLVRRRRRRAPAPRRSPTRTPRPATAGSTARCGPGSCSRATTSARAGWPPALAELCIAGRLGIDVGRPPPRRPGHGAVRRVDRAAGRRGPPRRRRRLPGDGRPGPPPRHRHRRPVLALPGVGADRRRRPRRRLPPDRGATA